ncbi:MAG: TM0106 family RecB-like putative nuclease [bacterium]|nr:TM0106 family RecB-like putative nuclease [bacterium]
MKLSASDIHALYRPSLCERRIYLNAHEEPGAKPGEFEELLSELGRRHEEAYLAAFPEHVNLSGRDMDRSAARTLEAVRRGEPVIYQGAMKARLDGSRAEVTGVPDLMIRDNGSYVITDCKLSRHADFKTHPEIFLQLQLYGWLFEKTFRMKPAGLKVYRGDRTLEELPYGGGADALRALDLIRAAASLRKEPYSPVGWSKCAGCPFQERCWKIAEDSADPAILPDIDQSAAKTLREMGVRTIDDLLARFDEKSLRNVSRPSGKTKKRIGSAAGRILRQAAALKGKQRILLGAPELPDAENWVMFDLEGLPPWFEELDKIYLWGTQVFGERKGGYRAAMAGFGADGDREGWFRFLENGAEIFQSYGDIPFVHWHNYETTKIRSYIGRYGDRDGIGERVLKNCLNLLPVTKKAVVLPVPSYSLKVIEKQAGFIRSMEEFGGDWSIARYIRAVETGDDRLRREIVSEIQKYNREDLEATWAVLQWLKGI